MIQTIWVHSVAFERYDQHLMGIVGLWQCETAAKVSQYMLAEIGTEHVAKVYRMRNMAIVKRAVKHANARDAMHTTGEKIRSHGSMDKKRGQ